MRKFMQKSEKQKEREGGTAKKHEHANMWIDLSRTHATQIRSPRHKNYFHGQWPKTAAPLAPPRHPSDGQAAPYCRGHRRWTLDKGAGVKNNSNEQKARYLLKGDDEDAVGAT